MSQPWRHHYEGGLGTKGPSPLTHTTSFAFCTPHHGGGIGFFDFAIIFKFRALIKTLQNNRSLKNVPSRQRLLQNPLLENKRNEIPEWAVPSPAYILLGR